ncbi:MAG: hypothetical protein AAGC68_06965 [Verrucomicrobiota bacterium]
MADTAPQKQRRSWPWYLFGHSLVVLLTAFLAARSLGDPMAPEYATALHTTYQLKNASSAYETEYGTLPHSGAESDRVFYSDAFFLTAITPSELDTPKNPRRIVFYAGIPAKEDSHGRHYQGLSQDSEGRYLLWDPWGNHYRIALDCDNDGRIPDPMNPSDTLPESIVIWSAGADGDCKTWEDNPRSW